MSPFPWFSPIFEFPFSRYILSDFFPPLHLNSTHTGKRWIITSNVTPTPQPPTSPLHYYLHLVNSPALTNISKSFISYLYHGFAKALPYGPPDYYLTATPTPKHGMADPIPISTAALTHYVRFHTHFKFFQPEEGSTNIVESPGPGMAAPILLMCCQTATANTLLICAVRPPLPTHCRYVLSARHCPDSVLLL